MTQTTQADGGAARITDTLSLAEIEVGDRIDPKLVPRSPEIEAGDRIRRATSGDPDGEQTYDVRLIAEADRFNNDVVDALVYDPDAGLFARLSGHTNSAAWSQREADWKVRDVGDDAALLDCWDVAVHDLPDGETEHEFVAEWLDILVNGRAHGEFLSEVEQFNGDTMTLRDADGRCATLQYELVTEDA
jgi:hypothetical protein